MLQISIHVPKQANHARLNPPKNVKPGMMGKRAVEAKPISKVEAIKPIEKLRSKFNRKGDDAYERALASRVLQEVKGQKDKFIKLLPSHIRGKFMSKAVKIASTLQHEVAEVKQSKAQRTLQLERQEAYNMANPLDLSEVRDVLLIGDEDVELRGNVILIEGVKRVIEAKIEEKENITDSYESYMEEKRIKVSEQIAVEMGELLNAQSQKIRNFADLENHMDFLETFEKEIGSVENAIVEFGRKHAHENYQNINNDRLAIINGHYDSLSTKEFIKKFENIFGSYAAEYLESAETFSQNPKEAVAFRQKVNRLVEAKLTVDPPVLLDELVEISVLREKFQDFCGKDLETLKKRDIFDQFKDFILEDKDPSKYILMRKYLREFADSLENKVRCIWESESYLGDRNNYLLHNRIDKELAPIQKEYEMNSFIIDSEIKKMEAMLSCLEKGTKLDVPSEVAIGCAIDNLESLMRIQDLPKKYYKHWPVVLSNVVEALEKSATTEPDAGIEEVVTMINQLIRDRKAYQLDEKNAGTEIMQFCLDRLLELQIKAKVNEGKMYV